MSLLDLIRSLVKAFAARQAAIEAQAQAQTVTIYRAVDVMDQRAVTLAAAEAALAVREAQQALAEAADEYLDAVFDALGETTPGPTKLPFQIREVNPIEEWERPAAQGRYAITQHRDPEPATLARVRQLTQQDVALAGREAEAANIRNSTAVGWRRIIHPELSREGVCGLCVVAADRTYSKETLKALHGGCHCTVLPVFEHSDPGISLHDEDLGAVYEAAGGTARQKLRRVRVRVVEHGEVGPVLVDAAKGGAAEADRPVRRTPPERVVRLQLDALAGVRDDWVRRGRAGEDMNGPLRWQADRVKDLRRQLAA